jgi:hypothetical protein
MTNKKMTNKKESPSEFHHVTFSVSKVSKMEMFRTRQTIIATASIKMDKENAMQLIHLLQEQIDTKIDGDVITFSMEGKFT